MGDENLGNIYKLTYQIFSRKGESPLTDAHLLERFAASRDAAAFELLVRRHSATVLNACRRVLGEHDAEDVVQATFLILILKAGSIACRQSLAGWLCKVARRLALKAKAKAASQASREQQRALSEAVEDPTPACVWQEIRSMLDEEIERLPRRYRLPFVLCDIEGKSNAEAGRELGCATSTIATRLAWARQRLANQLNRRGVMLPAGLGSAVAWDQIAAATAVPPRLSSNIVRAGLAYATSGVRSGNVSTEAVALAEGVVHAMWMTKIGVGVGIIIFAGLLAGGLGLVMSRKSARPLEAKKTEGVRHTVLSDLPPQKPPTEAPPKRRLDQGGDTLPEGALARLGTLRFRHEHILRGLAYSLDGKILIGGGENFISFWNSTTGEELRNLKASGYILLSRDGKSLAGAWFDTLWMRDFPSGKLRWQKNGVSARAASRRRAAAASRVGKADGAPVAPGRFVDHIFPLLAKFFRRQSHRYRARNHDD